jgi:hypothetical protein
LPTAWRLAREHGGDVRFEYLLSGPTRFVMTLPGESSSNGSAAAFPTDSPGNGKSSPIENHVPDDDRPGLRALAPEPGA